MCYWVFTFLAFQWISIVHNKKLSRTPFKRVQLAFITTNWFLLVVVVALFGVMIFGDAEAQKHAAIVGPAFLASVCFILSLSIILYGYWLGKLLSEGVDKAGDAQKQLKLKRARAMYWKALTFAIGFMVQSVVILTASLIGPGAGEGFVLVVLTCINLGAETTSIAMVLRMYCNSVQALVNPKRKRTRGGSTTNAKSSRKGSTTGEGVSLHHRRRSSGVPLNARHSRGNSLSIGSSGIVSPRHVRRGTRGARPSTIGQYHHGKQPSLLARGSIAARKSALQAPSGLASPRRESPRPSVISEVNDEKQRMIEQNDASHVDDELLVIDNESHTPASSRCSISIGKESANTATHYRPPTNLDGKAAVHKGATFKRVLHTDKSPQRV